MNGCFLKFYVAETIAAVHLAHSANWGATVSHRSGETVDTFIADLTVALGLCALIGRGSRSMH